MFRLKELRTEIGMTRAALSRAVNINQGTLANYENELRQADYDTLIVLSKFFDVTVDYILGVTNDFGSKKDEHSEAHAQKLNFIEQNLINKYRELNSKSKELVFEMVDHLHDLNKK